MTQIFSSTPDRAGRADSSQICVDNLTRLAISCNYHGMADDQQRNSPQQQQDQQITLPDGLPRAPDSPCSPSLTTAAGSCATQSGSETPMTGFPAPEPSFFPPTAQAQDQLPDGAGPATSLGQQTSGITTAVTNPQPQSTGAAMPLSLATVSSSILPSQDHLLQQQQRHHHQQIARVSASPQQLSPSQTPWPAASGYGDDFDNYSLHNASPTTFVTQSVPSSQAASPRTWNYQDRVQMMWKNQQQQQQASFAQSQARIQQQQQHNAAQMSLGSMVGDSAFGSPYGSNLPTTTATANAASLAFASNCFGEQDSIYPLPVSSSMQQPASSYPAMYQHNHLSSLVNGMSPDDANIKAEGGMSMDDNLTSPTLSEFDDEYHVPMGIHGGDGSIAMPPIASNGMNGIRSRPGNGIGTSQKGEEPYAQLIYKALMSRESHVMSLQEIYQWFRDNTDKGKSDHKGWQNSIRHNLSMNLAFQKKSNKPPSPSPNGTPSAHDANKKTNEWYLEPWAVTDGVQSTTRYRKGGSSRRKTHGTNACRTNPSRNGCSSSSNTSNPSSGTRSAARSPRIHGHLRSHAGINGLKAKHSPPAQFSLPYGSNPYHPHQIYTPAQHIPNFRARHSLDLYAPYPSPPPQHSNPHHALPLPMPLSSSSGASSTATGPRDTSEPLTPPPSTSQQQLSSINFDVDSIVYNDSDKDMVFAEQASDVPGLAGLMCGGGIAWAGGGEYGYRKGMEEGQQGQGQGQGQGEAWCG